MSWFRFTGLWRHGDFVRLWAGQSISQFGTLIGWSALQFTAILWLEATPVQVSVLAACQLAPAFLVGPLAGVLADRRRRRPLLIAADAGRAAALALVPLAALAGLLRMELLYGVAIATSALGVLFDVAYEAYLPSLVRPEQLVEGNAKLTASASVAEIGGFGLSGWLVQALTAPAAVALDALSFLWSALWVGRIRAREPAPEQTAAAASESRGQEAMAGLRFLWGQPVLRALALSEVVQRFAERIIGTAILLYLSREAGFSPGVLGMVFAVGGLSSLFGAVVAARSAAWGRLGPSLVVALLLRALGALCIPLAATASPAGLLLIILSQVITDPAWAFSTINELSLRQAVTPEQLRGRVGAALRVLGFGAMLLGALAAGLLGAIVGLRAVLFLAAGLIVASALPLLSAPVRRLRSVPGGA